MQKIQALFFQKKVANKIKKRPFRYQKKVKKSGKQ